MKKWTKKLISFIVFYFGISVSAFPYSTDLSIISSSHLRSSYYLTESTTDNSKSFEQFLKSADRNIPVIIHLHGCSGVIRYETDLKNFYTSIGYHFVVLDFHKRKDASPSCSYINGVFRYHGNMIERVKVRLLELNHHIDLLKEHGFKKLYATGHSEGGFVVQMVDRGVEAVIIHSMFCNPMAEFVNNKDIKFLHLISFNDPLLSRPGLLHTCNNRLNYKTITSQVRSHDPLADENWKNNIKNFLSKEK
jgi:hypothetical protein